MALGPEEWIGSSIATLHKLETASCEVVSLVSPNVALLEELTSSETTALICMDGVRQTLHAEDAALEAMRPEVTHWTFALELARRAGCVIVAGAQPIQESDLAVIHKASAENRPRRISLGQQTTDAGSVIPDSDPDGIQATIVKGCVIPLRNMIVGTGDPTIVWNPAVFLDGDNIGQRMPVLLEVAGRPRILSYGPYLPLPSGRWRVTASLGFSQDINRLPLIIELDSGGVVARGYLQPEFGGLFSASFVATIRNLLAPAEFRIISQESALEGKVALIKVEIQSYD